MFSFLQLLLGVAIQLHCFLLPRTLVCFHQPVVAALKEAHEEKSAAYDEEKKKVIGKASVTARLLQRLNLIVSFSAGPFMQFFSAAEKPNLSSWLLR